YVAIMTHGHGHDLEVLAALIDTDLRYLALLGSRAKVAKLTATLRERGVPADLIKRVKAPAGLPIHSHTPAEIAISIAAEIVKLRDSSSS
ncbi:MAG: XdhC/CoxF family protein, partial [bacterium]|nr:XdhC/CoxF family protein [bacterium]